MAAFINTNISSLNAQRNLNSSQGALASSLQRLSSGLRINSAKDDAAGLAITERMSTQIRGLNQAARNANDGISLAQTAEGALGEIGNNLQRIRELAVQSRNATNSSEDRAALQKEVAQLKSEIDRVANDTSFNGIKLLDGSFTTQAFQVGANQGQTISINSITDANIAALGSWTSIDTAHAPVTGVAAAGSGGSGAVPGTGSIDLSGVTPTNGDGFNFDAFDLTIGGTTFTVAATSGETSAADGRIAAAANIKTAIDAQNIAGLTVTDNGDGTLDFSNTGAAVTITDTDNVLGGDVTVTAQTAAVPGTFNAITAGQLTINGTDITVGGAADAATRVSDLVTAINSKTDTTGVKAEVSSGNLMLTSVSGSGNINIQGSATAAVILEQTGLTKGDNLATPGTAQNGFNTLDISTVTGADNAIKAMDAALNAINSARADLGAVQNRFTSVVANLQTTSENLSASRSRIQDADFAAETASLTRGQILQQAGTAMLAQANSLPNNVLSLLRG
ncbi:flagellin [Noviherbaspirillum sp.]|uniref:flagellin n=1 Tax=Noviherbaspirillum sp. TaxID=1926288 RepID=UPI002D4E6765|nr:flagellin [Noviherbaspirillum sp.]HZW20782.1 flagellin [Noviherbaspirillum sp.]